jgi:hypothetical protein
MRNVKSVVNEAKYVELSGFHLPGPPALNSVATLIAQINGALYDASGDRGANQNARAKSANGKSWRTGCATQNEQAESDSAHARGRPGRYRQRAA